MAEKQNLQNKTIQPAPIPSQPPPADLDEFIFRHDDNWRISDR